MPSKPRFAVTLAALGAYAAALHWTFQFKIAPVFGDLGARYRDPDLLNYALVALALVLVAMTLPPRLEHPSDGVVWTLFVMLAAPAALVPQYALIIEPTRALVLGLAVCGTFAGISALSRVGPFSGALRVRLPAQLVWLGLAAFSVLTYGYVYAAFGLGFVSFSLDAVRDLRFAYRDQISASGPLLGYLIRFQGSVVNPFLMAAGVLRRNWGLLAAGVIGQALLFSATGYKLFFLSIAVIPVLTWVLKRRPRVPGQIVLLGILAAALGSLAIDAARGGPILWTEIVVNRLLIVPGMLTAAYLQVFENRPGYNFADVIPIASNDYTIQPGFYVGAIFTGNPQANANAGYIGDGYAQLGYIGILIEAAGVLAILWGLNATGRHLPVALTFPTLLLPTVSLANVSPFTTLLTGGFAFAFILMACLPEDEWRAKEKVPRPRSTLAGRSQPRRL